MATTPVLDHLLGAQRGTRERVSDASSRIGTAPDANVRFATDPRVAPHHATLTRHGDHYLLAAQPGQYVEINGQPVASRRLTSGDTVRIGRDGPVLRFRECEGEPTYRSIPEVYKDCVDTARLSRESWPGRAGLVLKAVPRELITQTSPWSRPRFCCSW